MKIIIRRDKGPSEEEEGKGRRGEEAKAERGASEVLRDEF